MNKTFGLAVKHSAVRYPGINTLVSKEVSIPKIGITIRYRKVSIPELGIKMRYRKVSIPGKGIEIGYRKVDTQIFFDTS